MSSMGYNDARLANSTTGIYLQRSFNIEPPSARFMPGVGRAKNYSERLRMGKDCDEVYPGIIIGTGETAKNMKYLLDIGVTHLLNTAENDCNMNPKKYGKEGICYKGFRCPDLPQADISQFFDECVEFIDRALSFSCGKVFVSCLLGYSRSTAIVAAYLMQKKNFTAAQALMMLRETRECKPNLGFLQQLGTLDNKLRAQRYRKLNYLTFD
eukprot:01504.XXX_4838_2476_1 [CDS] Oithona nana genome sequencing.